MKSIMLVVLLALSLYGDGSSCKHSFDEYAKSSKAFGMAYERFDVAKMRVENRMSIYYIERAILDCEGIVELEELEEIRKIEIENYGRLRRL